MAIDYPAEVKTDLEKFEYVSNAYEAIRLEHNASGAKFNKGDISDKEWNDYLTERFNPIHDAIMEENANLRANITVSATYNMDLGVLVI